MDDVMYWISKEGSGHYFFIAFPFCLLILLIFLKRRRFSFVIPSLLMSIVIINPLFYRFWQKLGLYAYWRILWIVPVIAVVAGVIPAITEYIDSIWLKTALAALGVGLTVVGGTYLYKGTGGRFQLPAKNIAKLPQAVVESADRLLEMEESPRILAEPAMSVYYREYCGEIRTLFGRDIYGYISQPRETAIRLNNYADMGDWENVNKIMLEEGYDYVVTTNKWDVDTTCFEKVLDETAFDLYSPVGISGIVREWNELDKTTKESYFDINGEPLLQTAGYAAIEQEWENNDLISRTYLDPDGHPINRVDGYSKVIWEEIEGVKTVRFYDIDGGEIPSEGLNLIKDMVICEDGWSEWFAPGYKRKNSTIYFNTISLDDRVAGDSYTCQFDIEFRGVTGVVGEEFLFQTQGSVDGKWNGGNIWTPDLICLKSPPGDGIQRCLSTIRISEKAVHASEFSIGFRFDHWASGEFRIKGVKIEKGQKPTEWTPGI